MKKRNPTKTRKKILIVEDQPKLSAGLRKMLRELKYNVVGTVQTGREAVQKTKTLKPDLVLMDIVLKGKMDGIHAAKQIRDFNTPVIFMTAYADEEKIEEAKATDPFGYIIKPFEKEELEAVIEIALQKKKKETKSKNLIQEAYEETNDYLNLVGSMVVVLDTKGKIVLVNKKGYETLGYKENELNNKDWFTTCLPKDQRTRIKELFNEIVTGNLEIGEYWENEVLCKNKERKMISWHNTVQKNNKGEITRVLCSGEDITEQRKVSIALKKSEERYRIVAKKTGNLVYDYNVSTGQINWLGAIKEVTGYFPKEFNKVDIKKWAEMIHPEDRKMALQELEKSRKETGLYNAEYRFKHKKGHYINIEEHGIFLVDSMGERTRMLGAMKDVSRQKKIAEKLIESEQKYRSITENALEMIMVIQNGKFVLSNQRIYDVLGYSKKDIDAMKSFLDFVHPEDKLMVAERHQARLQGRKIVNDYSFRILNKKKEIVWVEISANAIMWDSKPAVLVMMEDITEKKEKERRLKESEAELRQVHEKMLDGFVVTDLDGNFLEANPAYCNMLGYSMSELKKMDFWSITPKKWHKFEGKFITNKISKKGTSGIYEKEYIRKNGEVFPVELNVYLIRNEQGKAIKMMGFARDITEGKVAEMELKKFRLGFEQSQQIIFTTNVEGEIEYVNPEFERTYGYKKKEVIGKTPRVIKSDQKNSTFYKEFWKKLLSKKAFRIELTNKAKNGKLINISASLSPILDENNELKGFMAIQSNITKQVKAEIALKEKVEQMEFMGRTNLKRHKRMMQLEKENMKLKEKLKGYEITNKKTLYEK